VDASQAVGTREMAGSVGAVPVGRESGGRNPGNVRKQVAGSVSVKSSLLHHRGRPLTTYDLGTVIIIIIIIIIIIGNSFKTISFNNGGKYRPNIHTRAHVS